MASPIGRVLLMDKGAYSGSTVYNQLDWVRDNGAAWVCKVDGTVGIAPPTLPTTSNANWTLMAADGSVSGSIEWSAVNNKPFDDIDTTEFEKDVSNNLRLKNPNNFGTIKVDTHLLYASCANDTIEFEAGNNVTITTDNVSNPNKITIAATGGGGGSSTLAGLDDTNISSPTNDQVLKYDSSSSKWVNGTAPQGGHTMIPTTNDIATIAALSDGTDNYVINAYSAKRWSNTESVTLLTTVPQGEDTMGTWEADDTWETSGVRTGWLCHELLTDILSDNDVEMTLVFDPSHSELVSAYAYRIDDEIYEVKVPVSNPQAEGLYEKVGTTYVLTTDTTIVSGKTYYVGLGGIAIKFNGAIQSNSVTVGVRLKWNRTQTISVVRS